MERLIKILSIDGGGIRGIIPAVILAEIERRTGKQIAELFDLIAGTSTGGILALGLTKPDHSGKPEYSARELINLYEEEGEKIFNRSAWIPEDTQPIFRRKYPSTGIESVLDQYFKDVCLSEALQEVLVTSYDIEKRRPYFFKREKATREPTLHDFPMKCVARATSAAPTYFEPLKLDVADHSTYYALIDGGVFANNPAMCAYVEAKTLYPDASDFLVVSIGTGELTNRLPYDDVKNWGMVPWVQPLLSITFDGVSDTVDYQLRQLLPDRDNGTERYYRLQTENLAQNDQIDDASSGNIKALKDLAERVLEKQEDDLQSLCDQLKASVLALSC